MVAFFYFYKKLSVLGSRACVDTVFPAQIGPFQATMSLAAVSRLTDGWARVALVPGKPQQHVMGAAALMAPGLDYRHAGYRGVVMGPCGGRVWGHCPPQGGCSCLSCDMDKPAKKLPPLAFVLSPQREPRPSELVSKAPLP